MDMAVPPLPDDIIIRTNILTRLAVKSLLRFRCVCKLWNSLISETNFIKDHLINCTTQNSILIFKKHVYDIHARKKTADIAILSLSDLSETRLFDALPYTARNIDMLGSINGLVCLFLRNLGKFILWNPAIRQAMKINSPDTHFMLRDVTRAYYGLCWDAMENDFKVVDSYYMWCESHDLSSYIYSCNSGSWSLLPNFKLYGSYQSLVGVPSAVVNGVPYWKYYWNYRKNKRLIKFDFGSKEFRWLPQLEVASGQDLVVVNLKESLCAVTYKEQAFHSLVDVHCFDERCGVWSEMYNFGVPVLIDCVLSCF